MAKKKAKRRGPTPAYTVEYRAGLDSYCVLDPDGFMAARFDRKYRAMAATHCKSLNAAFAAGRASLTPRSTP
jgi:hypothetical protein